MVTLATRMIRRITRAGYHHAVQDRVMFAFGIVPNAGTVPKTRDTHVSDAEHFGIDSGKRI